MGGIEGGVLLAPCGACGKPVSSAAPQCPACGHPVKGASKPKSKDLSARQIVGVLALIALLVVAWFAYSTSSSDTRDSVNRVASVVGVPIVPWPERARTAIEAMCQRQSDDLAQTILKITHPTGGSPQLKVCKAAAEGEQLVVQFEVAWKGGILGSAYATAVEWRCSKTSDLGARVVSDNAMIGVAQANALQLESYFRTSVYPVLLQNAN